MIVRVRVFVCVVCQHRGTAAAAAEAAVTDDSRGADHDEKQAAAVSDCDIILQTNSTIATTAANGMTNSHYC